MSPDARQAVRAVANLAVLGALVWLSMPNRPPLAPYFWRSAARVAARVAEVAQDTSLYARSRYWRAVQS